MVAYRRWNWHKKSKHQRGGDIHATNEKSESENPILHDFKGDWTTFESPEVKSNKVQVSDINENKD